MISGTSEPYSKTLYYKNLLSDKSTRSFVWDPLDSATPFFKSKIIKRGKYNQFFNTIVNTKLLLLSLEHILKLNTIKICFQINLRVRSIGTRSIRIRKTVPSDPFDLV